MPSQGSIWPIPLLFMISPPPLLRTISFPLYWIHPISTLFSHLKNTSHLSPPLALEPTALIWHFPGNSELPAAQSKGPFFILILPCLRLTQRRTPSSRKSFLPLVPDTTLSQFCCHLTSCCLDLFVGSSSSESFRGWLSCHMFSPLRLHSLTWCFIRYDRFS